MTVESQKYIVTITLDRKDLLDLADILCLADMAVDDLGEGNQSVPGRKSNLAAWHKYLTQWVPK